MAWSRLSKGYTGTVQRTGGAHPKWKHEVFREDGHKVGQRVSSAQFRWVVLRPSWGGMSIERYTNTRPGDSVSKAVVEFEPVGGAECVICQGVGSYSPRCADGRIVVVECHGQSHKDGAS